MRTTIFLLIAIAGLTFSTNSSAQTSGSCDLVSFIEHQDSACYTLFKSNPIDSTLSYFWNFGDGNSSNQIQPEHYYGAAGEYIVQLIVSNGMCNDTVMKAITTTTCHIPCNINATFIARDTFECHTAFDPLYYNYDYSYSWDLGDGTTSTDVYLTHLYSTPGNYTVTLIVSDSVCSDTTTQTISVVPCDTSCDLNASIEHYDSLCYTGFIPHSTGANSYFWDFGDGQTSTANNPEHFYIHSGQYSVTLIASGNNCVDTITQSIAVIACDTTCSLDASFNYSDSVCYVSFIPNTLGSSYNYDWDLGDGTSSSDNFPFHQYTNPGNYTVTLIVSDSVCSDTTIQQVTVAPCDTVCPLDANFSQVNTSGNTYSFSPTTVVSNTNYHWIFGDGTTSTDTYATHTYADEDDYFVTLVVSDCNCSASETLVVTVADSNNCGYNGDFTYQVENDGSYTFTPVYQSPNYEYYWTFGDGSSAYNMLPNYSYGTNGNFTVSLNIWEPGNGACSDTTYQNIQVNDSSACQLNSSFTTSTDTSNNVIHFYPDIYNPNYDYFWDFGDGQTSTFHSPNHSYSSNGMYTVTLTVNFDSCQSVDSTYIPMLSANLVNNEGSNSEVNIYPNPTSDFLTIDFNTLNSEKIQISLIDMNGKLIKQEFFTPNKGKNHKQINVQTISQGMYQLVLREKNGTFIHRVRFVKN